MSPDDYVELALRLVVELLALLWQLAVWINEVLPPELRNMILFFLLCLIIIRGFTSLF